MHAPAVALAWEFWWRHRWGLAAVFAVVAGSAVGCALTSPGVTDGYLLSVWFGMGMCFVAGVFAYGSEGRLEAAESGFPARLFVLPVRTGTLVGWPMLQGMAVAVGLLLVWDAFVLRRCGIETPAWLPALLAAGVAVSQALVWFPFGLPWVRLLVAVVVLSALVRPSALYGLLPEFGVSEEWAADPGHRTAVLTGFAAALVPLSFLVAFAGVKWARRGDTPDWVRAWRSVRRPTPSWREGRSFTSAAQAQAWYEWRLRGRGFVVTVVALVAVLGAVALLLEHRTNRPDFGVTFLFVPPVIAAYWGSHMGSSGTVRSAALSAFAATRPLNNVQLVAAKARAATRATATAWVIVPAVTVAWYAGTNGFDRLERMWEAASERYGAAKAAGAYVGIVVGLILVTWRAMVVNLWATLAGRQWVGLLQPSLMTVVAFQVLAEYVKWESDALRRERLHAAIPWVLGTLVAVKLLCAAGALRALVRRGDLRPRTVAAALGLWALAAAGLTAALCWLVPATTAPAYDLALIAALFVPLARLAVAPLALAWNRHR